MNLVAASTSLVQRALDGPRHLLLGYRLLLRPSVRSFMLIPVLGNALLYTLAAVLAFYGLDAALDRWLPTVADWLRWLLYPLLAAVLLVIAFFTFTLVGNLVLAPFNGLLSERVEALVAGSAARAPDESFWDMVRRSSGLALWRIGFILIRLVGVFLLGLIPVIGFLALPVGLLLGAWLLALEFSDAPMGNWGWSLEQQRALVRQHRVGFIGFGLAAMGMALVPVLNFALIPAAVSGMTAYCLHLRNQGTPGPAPA